MSTEDIIEILAKFPNLNIAKISKLTSIKTIELSRGQHDHMKTLIKRDSPLWGNDDEILPEN